MMTSEHQNAYASVTNSQFLAELARPLPADSLLWIVGFIGNPDGYLGWRGHEYDGSPSAIAEVDRYSRQNAYFSTAALRYIDGQIHRRKAHFSRLLALVVDDANPDDLESPASWVLNTSPGKRQVGFFLDEEDPDCADLGLVDALVTRMATMGLIGGDRSGNNAVRYVRLPQGENQKPRPSGSFQCKLLCWAPDVRYTLADAAAALAIDLDEIRAAAHSPQPEGTGTIHGDQDEKLGQATQNVIAGTDLHDSVNIIAASLIASGTHPGTVVNHLRALMNSSQAPRNERWAARYNDIARSVETAFQKFRQPSSTPTVVVDPSTGEILQEPLLRKVGDLLADLRPIEFVVDKYLETDALALVFGPPGSGKSFVSFDIACCVATGTPWHGMAVKKGSVILVVGEGLNGVGRRLKAWSIHNQVSLDDAPLYLSRHAVALGDQNAAINLAAEIDRIATADSLAPSLIVIDTLNRNFGDGDENSTQDMSRFVTNVDLYLRKRYRSNVCVVHHSGHDGSRARGSSALKAALDQEFMVSASGPHLKFECTKMKDAEQPIHRTFKITQVTIGTDAEGLEITGATIIPDGSPLEFQVGSRRDGGSITASHIVKAIIDGTDGLVPMQEALNCGQSAVRGAIEKTVQSGLIEKVKGGRWYRLTQDGIQQARSAGWIGDNYLQSSY